MTIILVLIIMLNYNYCGYGEKVPVIPRKRWLRPDMTEKILAWDVRPQHKQTIKVNMLDYKLPVVD